MKKKSCSSKGKKMGYGKRMPKTKTVKTYSKKKK